MGTNRNIFKWVFENIAPGEQNPQKRVDADRIMDNYGDVRDMVGTVEARGANAQNGNSRGVSTPTQCNLTLRTARGVTGLVNLGDYIYVWDGVGQWRFRNDVADDEISFGPAELVKGTGPADYSDPSFIGRLVIHARPFRPAVGKSDLILNGATAEKITGSDIETGASDPTPLGEKVGDLKQRVDVSLDEAGRVRPDAIENAALAPAVTLGEAFENVIWGGFESDFDNDGLANRWMKFNTPLCEMDASVRRIGTRSQKVIASQPWDGIYANPHTYCFLDFVGDYVAFSCWVRVSDAASVVLEVYDGVKTTTSAPGGVAGQWVRLGVEHFVDAGATDLQFRIYANRATVFHVDGAMAKRGRLQPGYSSNPLELVRSFMVDEDYANWIINGYFSEWTNGASSLPDFWRTGDGFYPPAAIARNSSWFVRGDASLRLSLGTGQGVWQDLKRPADFQGQCIFANAYLRGVTGAGPVRLGLRDDYQDYFTEAPLSPGAVLRTGVKMRVSSDATFVRFYLANAAGGEVGFDCDGVMVTRGEFPIAFRPPTGYSPVTWTFAAPGPVTGGRLWHHGTNADAFMVPGDCWIHKVLVYEGTAPASGQDVFTVTRNGTATALSVAVGGESNTAARHEVVAFAKGDRIQVVATPAAAPGSDAGVVVEGLVPKV